MVRLIKELEPVKVYVILPTNEVGGHEHMLLEWLTRARNCGLSATIFCRGGWSLSTLASDRGFECVETCYRDRGSKFSRVIRWANFLETYRTVRRLPSDIPVLLAPGSMHASILHLFACVLAKRSIVCYVPTAHSASKEEMKLASLRDGISRLLASRVSIWVTIGSSQKAELIERWRIARPVITIPNRISAMGGTRPAGAKRINNLNRLNVAFVGRFEPKAKGLDWLVGVLQKEARWRGRFRFVFQGRGAYVGALHQLVHAVGSEHVEIVGWGSPKAVLEDTDVLILTSRFEGFPLVAVEALMAAVPVVASCESGLADVLLDACQFSFGDESGMWAALDRMRVAERRDEAIIHATERLGRILSEDRYLDGIGQLVSELTQIDRERVIARSDSELRGRDVRQ